MARSSFDSTGGIECLLIISVRRCKAAHRAVFQPGCHASCTYTPVSRLTGLTGLTGLMRNDRSPVREPATNGASPVKYLLTMVCPLLRLAGQCDCDRGVARGDARRASRP